MKYYITTTIYYKNTYAVSNNTIAKIANIMLEAAGARKCTYALKGELPKSIDWDTGRRVNRCPPELDTECPIEFLSFECKESEKSGSENTLTGKLQSYQFSFIYNGNDFCEGVDPYTIIQFGFSNNFSRTIGTTRANVLIDQFYECASKYNPIYGFTDVATPKDTNGGICFGSSSSSDTPMWRIVENNNWYMSGIQKGTCVRGIYWANLLGDAIVKQVGGVNSIKNDSGFDGKLMKTIETDNKYACLLKLSNCFSDLDPSKTVPNEALDNLSRLQKFLGRRGVLNTW